MRSAVSTTRSRTRPRARDAAVGHDREQHRRRPRGPPRRTSPSTAPGGIPLLEDHRPVFEEETEERVHVVSGASAPAASAVIVQQSAVKVALPSAVHARNARVSRLPRSAAGPLLQLGSHLHSLRRSSPQSDTPQPAAHTPRQPGRALASSTCSSLVCATRNEPGPNNNGHPQRVQERHVGRERKHRRRKTRHRVQRAPAARAVSLQTSRTARAAGSPREFLPAGRSCGTAPPLTRAAKSRWRHPTLDQPDAVVGRSDRPDLSAARSNATSPAHRSICRSPTRRARARRVRRPSHRPQPGAAARRASRSQPIVGRLAVDQESRAGWRRVRRRGAVASALLPDDEQSPTRRSPLARSRSAAATCAARMPLASHAPRP